MGILIQHYKDFDFESSDGFELLKIDSHRLQFDCNKLKSYTSKFFHGNSQPEQLGTMDNKTYPGKHPKSVQKRDKLRKTQSQQAVPSLIFEESSRNLTSGHQLEGFLEKKTHTDLRGVVIGIANRSEHGHGACEKRHSLHPVFQLQFSSYDRISPMLNLTLIHRM